MSNPITYFLVGGTDLSSIFQPLSLGTPYGTPTGYKVGTQDFNDIFAGYPGSGTRASSTGYNFGGNDLSNIFAKYNPFVINVTNQTLDISVSNNVQSGFTIYEFDINTLNETNAWVTGSCNISFSTTKTINIIMIGGGGGGGYGEGTGISGYEPYINEGGGGGGGGGSSYVNTITVEPNITYNLIVGSGGCVYITSYKTGQSSSFIGGSLNLQASGGGPGGNANYASFDPTQGGIQTGGTSLNGGQGGNGGTFPGNGGQGGSIVTLYGTTIYYGGGGGGGINSNTITGTHIGSGQGGLGATNSNNGGSGGQLNTSATQQYGINYGGGGGGGGGEVLPSGYTGGGYPGAAGGNGKVILYWS